MKREKLEFIQNVFLRFALLSFVSGAIYVAYGGRLGIVFHAAPLALILSSVGIVFLIRNGNWPKDWTSLSEVSEFRSSAWRMMWVLNLTLLSADAFQFVRHFENGWEELGWGAVGCLIRIAVNSLVFMAVILAPVVQKQEASSRADPHPRSIQFKNFLYAMFTWSGAIGWFIVVLSLTVNLVERLQRDEKADAKRAVAREASYEKLAQFEREYAAKNCEILDWDVKDEKRREFYEAELESLKVENAVRK